MKQPSPKPRRRSLIRVPILTAVAIVVLGGLAYAALRMHWIDLDSFSAAPTAGGPSRASSAHVLFAGDANLLSAAPGNVVQPDKSDSSVVWLRSSVKAASATGKTDGVSVPVPGPMVQQFEGRRVVVTVSAAVADDAQPSPFAVAYSTGKTANSGWIVFTPTREFSDYKFSFTVPIGPAGDSAENYVGIWPDISGRQSPLALRQITVEPAP